MISGMTGFGSAQLSSPEVKGTIEIKSQNHRYFDLVFYLPSGFASIEHRIRQMIGKDVKRGRVTFSLKLTEKSSPAVSINKQAVKAYLKQARALKGELGLNDRLALSDILRLPGVVETKEENADVEILWPVIEKAVQKATQRLVRMRLREGQSLKQDMRGVLKLMMARVKKIQQRAQALLREKKKTLTDEEFVSFQKGSDVNEEITRLKHYIDEFAHHLDASASIGKNLDFVAQEMQRETNTIGSKVPDQFVANAVIAIKGKIEKLREQAQNIE